MENMLYVILVEKDLFKLGEVQQNSEGCLTDFFQIGKKKSPSISIIYLLLNIFRRKLFL